MSVTEGLSQSARREYLRAMGIDLWLPGGDRARPEDAAGNNAAVTTTAAPSSADATAPGGTAATPASAAAAQGADAWALLAHEVSRCTRCRLHETRTQPVFGVGDRHARLLIIGEAPGAEEDRSGEPFVGRAGQMLTAMLAAIGFARDDVFITNTLKCRPPQNRDPRSDEMQACSDYLQRQIDAIAPAAILAVGRIAAQQLLGEERPLGQMRGTTHRLAGRDIPVVVTYHPAYLLRTPAQKALAWQDLKRAKLLLEGGA